MNKKHIFKASVSVIVMFLVLFSVTFTLSDEARHTEEKTMYFEDVTNDKWYYKMVISLADANILPKTVKFKADSAIARYDIVQYLYNLGKELGIEPKAEGKLPFADVTPNTQMYDEILWAYSNGIVEGRTEIKFSPYGDCTKEQACHMIVQFMKYADIKAPAIGSVDAFKDSLAVSKFARSSVVALKLACIISGDENGNFRPWAPVKRCEFISMLYYLHRVALHQAQPGQKWVHTEKDAYLYCYSVYEAEARKAASASASSGNSPVNSSYFDDAVFVGDSVTASLQYFCASTGNLGKAKFLCATSLSPINAHKPVTSDSTHPVYLGEKLSIEDGVARIGANKVYIMLGINSLYTFDETVTGMKRLVDKIVAKSPKAKIIIQSVTPMTPDSPIKKATLNNDIIKRYNGELKKMADANGWHYINVYDAVADANGNLRKDYCSDPKTMGIHFNYAADEAWVNYLKKNTP